MSESLCALILDLDQTLVDSTSALSIRRSRQWSAVYAAIGGFSLYQGVRELLKVIFDCELPVAIVTSSPSSYAQRVIRHFDIDVDHLVCYHDTTQHKPHPAPIALAVERLGLGTRGVWSIGDEEKDVTASRAAGVVAGGALWGAADPDALRAADPHFIDQSPAELAARLRSARQG